ncbi:MAG: adaptor protein MecA [Catonella sp.]|nr:adaptor protein MecA [Catonella sp.]MDY6356088.1 adaptor protein MecA [Catonella sp.]
MKLYRLSDESLRCILNADDLKKYNLNVKDFVSQSDAADNFIHTIVEKAEEEIGYRSPHGAISMKVMQMPEDELCLTITETPVERLQPKRVNGNVSSGDAPDGIISLFELLDRMFGFSEMRESSAKKAPDQNLTDNSSCVLVFDSVDDAADFCGRIAYRRSIKSELYRMRDKYFLVLHKGGMSDEKFTQVLQLASEFSEGVLKYIHNGALLREHGEAIIPDKAVMKLKKLNNIEETQGNA